MEVPEEVDLSADKLVPELGARESQPNPSGQKHESRLDFSAVSELPVFKSFFKPAVVRSFHRPVHS